MRINNNIINEILLKYSKNLKILNIQKFLNIGNLISIDYIMFKNKKEYIQKITGLIIAKKKNSINTNITIKRTIDNNIIEQTFFLNSPKIISINIISIYKIRKSKLYFLRELKNKYKKLKIIK